MTFPTFRHLKTKGVLKHFYNKKVLLRERKRHTARRVASTPYVVLTGYPPRPGYPPHPGYLPSQGTRHPPARVPPAPPVRVPPSQGTPPPPTPWPGYPLARVPPGQGYPPARVPPGVPSGTPQPWSTPWEGYPPAWVPITQPGYPPGQGTPHQGTPPGLDLAVNLPGCPMVLWVMLQSIMGNGYLPCGLRQTDTCENITFPRTTYAGGNNNVLEDTRRKTSH